MPRSRSLAIAATLAGLSVSVGGVPAEGATADSSIGTGVAALGRSARTELARGAGTTAHGPPGLSLSASFSPERLGGATTIRVGFSVARDPRHAPRPVTAMQLFLPAGLGAITSDLGLETCQLAQLEAGGLAGCPPDSLMGRGSALTQVPFGRSFVNEPVAIALLSGPLVGGDPQLLFSASGSFPVIADIAFSALIKPDGPRYGALIDTQLPLVPSVPKGPDVALVALQTTIGPAGIVYYERVHGRLVSFRPRGILLPRKCPRGGFPFKVALTFSEGPPAEAATAVPCPRRRRG